MNDKEYRIDEVMKLILLRHEERDLNNPLFFSPLTQHGIQRSYDLISTLSMQNIDVIFCSPFLRTIETIYPTADFLHQKINIEYGLYEYIHNPKFNCQNWYHSIDELLEEYPEYEEIINMNYQSIVTKNDFVMNSDNPTLEERLDLQNRLEIFMNHLFSHYHDKTVLLVSHAGTLQKIKDMYIIESDMNDSFPMGHFEIYYL